MHNTFRLSCRPPQICLGAVLLFLAATANAQVSPAPTAAPADDKTSTVLMNPFEVSTTQDQGYMSMQSASSSKTVTSLLNSPNSISILNRDLMDDLNITSIPELSFYAITGEQTPQSPSTIASYTFRGIVSTASLRNGVIWSPPVDSYNVERVEVLRGPSAFLYGEGVATGVLNQVTKSATTVNFENAVLTVGSFNLRRLELDLNRVISPSFDTRINLAIEDSGSNIDFVKRDFKGITSSSTYRPGPDTTIKVQAEYGIIHETRPSNVLADGYTTTQLNGSTSAYTTASGGYTLVANTGQIFDMVGQRVSSGLNIMVSDPNVLPRQANYTGPNSYNNVDYDAVNVIIEQHVTDDFNFQISATRQDIYRYTRTLAGSLSGGVFLDTNALLPNGAPNPNVGQLYTEYSVNKAETDEFINEAKLTAAYDLKLPFMTQQIIAMGTLHDDTPVSAAPINEFIAPGSALFKGTLLSDDSYASYQANVNTMNANLFYRRFYLKNGDGAQYTSDAAIPGMTVLTSNMGGSTGRLVNRKFSTPSFGTGVSGSYFGDRFHTLFGWRRDYFIQTPELIFYNPTNGQLFKLPQSVQSPSHITKYSETAGAVLNITNFLSASFNYANSIGLSSGIGGPGYEVNTIRGLTYGDGYEYSLRWTGFGGKLESNWTYFISNQLHGTGPVPSSLVLNELQADFSDFNISGLDTQTVKSTGYEFETIMNLTSKWKLTWNLATDKLETSDRDPVLKSFDARAHALNLAVPNTDQFLGTIPDGTPVAGFTKLRTNLVTDYRFTDGWLKDFNVGGGFQIRGTTYAGNADIHRTGVAIPIYYPGYGVVNLIFGYKTNVFSHPVRLNFTINNLFDKQYLRVNALTGGVWGTPTTFRLSAGLKY